MVNWQTKLSGLGMLIGVAIKAYTSGHFDWAADGATVMGGIGLLSAKQHNVTGGTKEQ